MKTALSRLVERRELRFYVEFPDQNEDLFVVNKEIILHFDHPITHAECDRIHLHLIEICFIEIIQNWLVYLNTKNIL